MKNKLIIKFIIYLGAIITSMCIYAQEFKVGTPEYYKALGIEPAEITYRFEKTIPSLNHDSVPKMNDTIMYLSYYNENHFNGTMKHYREAGFTFNDNLIETTLNGQFKRIRSYGIIRTNNDTDHIFETHQCIDNSGSQMYVTFAFEKNTNVKIIILNYNSMIWLFEVEEHSLPKVFSDITDTEYGVFGDENFGTTYTNEEVQEFYDLASDAAKELKEIYFNEQRVEEYKLYFKHTVKRTKEISINIYNTFK